MFILKNMVHDVSALEGDSFQAGLVSAVIPVHAKKLQTIDACLRSILGQTYEPIEIILVNNGIQHDGSLVNAYQGRVRIEDLSRNFGASYARNHGALSSKGEFLWFVDSDVIEVDRDCVRNMLTILGEHPDIGAVGGLLFRYPGGTKLHLGQCEDYHYEEHPERYTLYDDMYVNTGCMMVKRRLMGRVRGFTEYIEYLHEDNDFGFKVRASGLRCVGDRRTFGLHVPRDNAPLDLDTQKMAYKNTLLYLFVNYRPLELFRFLKMKATQKQDPANQQPAQPASVGHQAHAPRRLRQLYAFVYVVAFLFGRLVSVVRLRHARQVLLQALRERQYDPV